MVSKPFKNLTRRKMGTKLSCSLKQVCLARASKTTIPHITNIIEKPTVKVITLNIFNS